MATPKKGSFRAKAQKMKKDLEKRHQEAGERTDERMEFGTYFNKDDIPEGVEFWKAEKGRHIIDIVPFFAGKNHPRDPEGRLSYVVDLYVHRNIGAKNTPIVCPQRNFDEPCPICEYISKRRLPKSEWDLIGPKRRTVYFVWVHDEAQKEEKKGLQIWEVSHWFFEKEIDELAKMPRGGGYVNFSDIDKGRSISFKVKSSGSYIDPNGQKQESIEFTGYQFIDREEKIPDSILDNVFPLDDVINMKTPYNEIKEMFDANQSDSENEELDEDPEPEDSELDDKPDYEEEAQEIFDGMDRLELRRYIKTNDINVKVYKTDTDDEIRDKIREEIGATLEGASNLEEEEPEQEEEPEEVEEDNEEAEGDEFDEMDRTTLRKYIKSNGLEIKVYKKDTDDEIRDKIRESNRESENVGCPGNGVYGKDANEYIECAECGLYDDCVELSEA